MEPNVKLIAPFGSFRTWYYTTEIHAWVRGTIIDLETRGLTARDNITALGLVKENRISCFVIHRDDESEYQAEFRDWIRKKLSRCPRPFAAYYKNFEEQFLETIDIEIELQPKAYEKQIHAIDLSYLNNSDNGSMVEANEKEIMEHVYADMITEMALRMSFSNEARTRRFPQPHFPFEEDAQS